jgi:hypothetical protein
MQFHFSYIFHESNKVADILANNGINSLGLIFRTCYQILLFLFVIMIGWVFLIFTDINLFVNSYTFLLFVLAE